jgi:hypothetical protein
MADFIKYFVTQSAVYAARSSDVHWGQRVAPIGMGMRQ